MLTLEHRPKPPVGTYVLLGVAGLFYLLMLVNLVDIGDVDPAGRGLNQAFAALAGLLLWIVLAILLVVGGVRGHMPLLAAMAAAILLPASAVAAIVAAELYERMGGWPILVPALLPLVFASYALWARLPQLRKHFPALSTSAFAGVAVLVMTAGPLAATWYADQPDPTRRARLAAEERAQHEERQRQAVAIRSREAAAFAKLGPDSSLADYLPYLHGEHAQAALIGIRLVKSRQADAVALLRQGRLGDLAHLREFNVEPTAELCQAYGKALAAAAAEVAPSPHSAYLSAAMALERQLPNITWLIGVGCDLAEPLALLETNVRAVADSPRMTAFADALARLREIK
ncbi:hypothetical protein [Enhydrobacter sp.]|uniref:hypothetical protein n=1 Tax=Enhydrobacter sp. TaxID=1894999 RepID=UPI002612543D|nr:hypothetical protein [Enhydrobacter sp.]WIM12243.1 MAG: hypothetical protein OJF58_003204 [Enhydrobacter sp.]